MRYVQYCTQLCTQPHYCSWFTYEFLRKLLIHKLNFCTKLYRSEHLVCGSEFVRLGTQNFIIWIFLHIPSTGVNRDTLGNRAGSRNLYRIKKKVLSAPTLSSELQIVEKCSVLDLVTLSVNQQTNSTRPWWLRNSRSAPFRAGARHLCAIGAHKRRLSRNLETCICPQEFRAYAWIKHGG